MLPVIVIPAYQPDQTLLDLVDRLVEIHTEQRIIIVDDGSTLRQAISVFEKLSLYPNVVLLKHSSNQGKGRALKTALENFLENFPESAGVITADADGQHLPEDIFKVLEALKYPYQLVLGARVFSKSVPWRSRFGNTLTRKVFSFFSRQSFQDTQTGLRGITREIIPDLLSLSSEGYEFEMDMLMQAVEKKWKTKEIPIKTVYLEQNRSSHFNPLKDSLKIYFVFIRYSLVSLLSAGLDLILFFSFFYLSRQVVLSTISARIFSGIFNFICGKRFIFKSGGKVWRQAFQYLCLAVISVILSSVMVSVLFYKIKLNIYASKILTDVVIFLCNFTVQRFLIFRFSSHAKTNSVSQ